MGVKKPRKSTEAEAREKGVSPSEIVRQALEEHMRQQTPRENCLELAERLGILGSAKGLPADLSTNPMHMEGSGVTERVLVDTGPMVALFSEDDAHHERCSDTLTALTRPCSPAGRSVTEAAWLLRTRPPAFTNSSTASTAGSSPCSRSKPTTCPPSPP